MKSLTLIPGQLSLSQLRDIYSHPVNITLDSGAFAAIDESVACVNAILAEGRTAYGINTGFGLLAQTRISTEDLENLQRSLVLSHAAALASENKALSHPHSVDSLPTSANQEDHVSMAPAAGRRLWAMAENTRGVLAVEWLAAAQGLDMREGLTTSPLLEEARHLLRERVPHYTQDRYFAPDIDNAIALLAARHLTRLLPAVLH